MLRNVHLHGRLAEFGGPYRINVDSARQAARLLAFQIPGLMTALIEGEFQVVRGDPDTGFHLGEGALDINLGRVPDLHFIPVIEGGKGSGKGIAKAVVGIALVVATSGTALGWFGPAAAGGFGATTGVLGITYGQAALFGGLLVLGGISSMLTPKPKLPSYNANDPPDQRASFVFNNGALNLTEQGNPVPLIYGLYRVGSVTISAGLKAEKL